MDLTSLTELTHSEPVATVRGQPIDQLPKDLYIPPQALKILLESFTGPLDLLLYLIKKQHFDVLDIPVAEVTRQYIQYIELMQVLEVELATEYLVMAAFLTEIKSRFLLPKPAPVAGQEEIDPRNELIRRLQEYEQIKLAAQQLDQLPRQGRDVFLVTVETEDHCIAPALPTLNLTDLLEAMQLVMRRQVLKTHHAIRQEPLSIRARMTQILQRLGQHDFILFSQFYTAQEGRMGVVVTFIALLELWRQSAIELVQPSPFEEIQVKAA